MCRYRPSGGELGPAYTPLATQEDSDSEEELFPVGGGRSAGHTLVYTWREYMRQVTYLPSAQIWLKESGISGPLFGMRIRMDSSQLVPDLKKRKKNIMFSVAGTRNFCPEDWTCILWRPCLE
jgi:hypothetical protein